MRHTHTHYWYIGFVLCVLLLVFFARCKSDQEKRPIVIGTDVTINPGPKLLINGKQAPIKTITVTGGDYNGVNCCDVKLIGDSLIFSVKTDTLKIDTNHSEIKPGMMGIKIIGI